MILKPNQTIRLSDGRKAVVTQVLGDGAQGEVYLAKVGSQDYALKMYKKQPSATFIANLESNIQAGSPSPAFLWPLALTEERKQVGYLMDLIPRHFQSFISMINGQAPFNSLRSQLNWCINLCMAFKELHSRGYSYQDLNDGGFFLDPETGEALICDNDNVTADKNNLGIIGKMKYMAPEVVLGKEEPDKYSDYFSLAIILFLTLTLNHPFLGERLRNYPCFDEAAEFDLFGKHPLYLFNPNDTSNRPIRGDNPYLPKRWAAIPSYVKEGFRRVFVDGLKDRENGRPTELEWIKLLFRWRDEIVTCRRDNFQYAASLGACPNCGDETPSLPSLTLGNYEIVLDLHARLYQPHIDKYSANYSSIVGEVISSKNNPSHWGIRNLSTAEWNLTDATGGHLTVPPQSVAPLLKDLCIDFGSSLVGNIH